LTAVKSPKVFVKCCTRIMQGAVYLAHASPSGVRRQAK